MQHDRGFPTNKLLSASRTMFGKTGCSTGPFFVSSNPSIDDSERYPDLTWTEDQISDFFHNRFGPTAGWVRDGLYTRQKDGSFSRNWVRFWAAARSRAAELLEKERASITPGLDFALTEVVHCKSRNEVGVKEAQEFCSKRYLDRILSVSAAKVIVVFGQSAKDVVVNQLSTSMRPLSDGERNLFAQEQRMIVFLAHPAALSRLSSKRRKRILGHLDEENPSANTPSYSGIRSNSGVGGPDLCRSSIRSV
jgi:hypothetical protein